MKTAYATRDRAIRAALIMAGKVKPAPKALFSAEAVAARRQECRRVTTGQPRPN